MGVSNISFGVPNRKALNNTYLNLALSAGLDLPRINPNEEGIMETINAFKVINNIDKGCVEYIKAYSGYKQNNIIKTANDSKNDLSLDSIVEYGLKENVKDATLNLLKKYDENYVLDEILIPSLDAVWEEI